jgi:hypothetical protein
MGSAVALALANVLVGEVTVSLSLSSLVLNLIACHSWKMAKTVQEMLKTLHFSGIMYDIM